jgi:hypothetical protein
MWLYVSSYRLCMGVSTYLVETMSWNVLEVAWKVFPRDLQHIP